MESVSITPDKKTTTESALADTTNSNPSQTSQSKRFQPLVEDDHSGDDVPGETGQGSTTTSGKLANNAATEALSENTTNPVMQNLGGTVSALYDLMRGTQSLQRISGITHYNKGDSRSNSAISSAF